jgi:hypothetical protein
MCRTSALLARHKLTDHYAARFLLVAGGDVALGVALGMAARFRFVGGISSPRVCDLGFGAQLAGRSALTAECLEGGG